MKYVLKPEKQSEFFTRLARVISKKVDDDTPLNKIAQKVLMNVIGQRDMPSQECFLIAHGKRYVDFSHKPRIANLKGNYAAKRKLKAETESLNDDDNWQESYWKREDIDGYRTLCADYEAGKVEVLKKHPRYLSLREFMVLFTKKWKYNPDDVWPHFIPTFRYTVKKGKPMYEEFCRSLLLQDKPGCTLDNVGKVDMDGKKFESCEDELDDFVKNSEYCPALVKEEYEESLRPSEEGHEGTFAEEDALLNQPEEDPEREPLEDWEWLNHYGDHEDLSHLDEDELVARMMDEAADPDPTYCDRLADRKGRYDPEDWKEHREELGITENDIMEAGNWIKKTKDENRNIRTKKKKLEVSDVNKDMLNFKQRVFQDLIEDWYEESEPLILEGKEIRPLYINVSGQAGCGKSTVLNCCRRFFDSKKKPKFMQVGAPTGSAAFLVEGNTLHKLLHLRISNSRDELKELSGQPLRDLQEEFEDVFILFIDEKSMVGQYMMYVLDQRLRQATGKRNLPFGGISIILMGDFSQVIPVKDTALYIVHEEGSKDIRNPQKNHGHHLFETYFMKNTIILDQIMRQGKGQEKFKELLEKIRNGNLTKDDWEYLREKCELGRNFSPEERKEIKSKAIKVCALVKDLKQHNIERIKALGKPIAAIKAYHFNGPGASVPLREAGNLPQDMLLAVGCRIVLTRNLWPEAGLTNGAIGEVKYIIYRKNDAPPNLPAYVICKFDQYIGPSYLEGEEKLVPIVPEEHVFHVLKKECKRKMLPLKAGYAISIHCSQGHTLEKVIVDLGPKEFATGLAYVACSRVRRLEDLYFDPMYRQKRFTSFRGSNGFKQRYNQDTREIEADRQFVARTLENLEKKKAAKN